MDTKIVLIIIGMSIVTHIPRIMPLVVLSKLNLPPLLLCWLKYIPVAVLSALLAPAILMPEGKLAIGLDNKYLIASLPCFIISIKTKNLFLTVVTGIITMMLLQLI